MSGHVEAHVGFLGDNADAVVALRVVVRATVVVRAIVVVAAVDVIIVLVVAIDDVETRVIVVVVVVAVVVVGAAGAAIVVGTEYVANKIATKNCWVGLPAIEFPCRSNIALPLSVKFRALDVSMLPLTISKAK